MFEQALQVKLLSKDAVVPTRGSEYAAGWDLYLPETVTLRPGEVSRVGFQVAVAIPEGYVGLLVPRSSAGVKLGVRLANTVGVIDSDYRGEVVAALTVSDKKVSSLVVGEHEVVIHKGSRICQLVVVPVNVAPLKVVSSLPDTLRGEGGFGSTGC